MTTYPVRHLTTGKTHTRPYILHNPHASNPWPHPPDLPSPSIKSFHRSLPDYNQTPLHNLTASLNNLPGQVFLKDESTRFSLPAFKILGASYAIHRTLCQHLHLPPETALAAVKEALAQQNPSKDAVKLVTCSEGNWGRAVARMSKLLSLPVKIYVPWFMVPETADLIRSEGAEVIFLEKEKGSYDDSIAAVQHDAEKTGALMVMDVAWEGYEEIPHWVTKGYTTMLTETTHQLPSSSQPTHLFVSIGVGSWAHAVVTYYKSLSPSSSKIISVEPEAAASLKESLHCDRLTPIETGETIMAGMNCGTTSKIAWPVLREGIHAAVVVTDREAHAAVEELEGCGVRAGPCGAATLAALRKYLAQADEKEKEGMVAVLFSTEGAREYEIPQ